MTGDKLLSFIPISFPKKLLCFFSTEKMGQSPKGPISATVAGWLSHRVGRRLLGTWAQVGYP